MKNNTNGVELIGRLSPRTLSPCCPTCGHQRHQTLAIKLHNLVEDHSLIEVLDRLAHLVHAQKILETDPHAVQPWSDLVRQLEVATEGALAIANQKEPGASLWR